MHQDAPPPFAASPALQREEGAGQPAFPPPIGDAGADGGEGGRADDVPSGSHTGGLYPMRVIEILSHELRSPITTIHLGTKVLREQGNRISQPVRLEVVEAVEEEAERLYRLVEDLLAVARHEGGAAPLPVGPIALQHWLAPVDLGRGPGVPHPARPGVDPARPAARHGRRCGARPGRAQPARERDPLRPGRDARRDRGLARPTTARSGSRCSTAGRACRPTRPRRCSSRSTGRRRPSRSVPGQGSGSPRHSG